MPTTATQVQTQDEVAAGVSRSEPVRMNVNHGARCMESCNSSLWASVTTC